MGRMVTPKSTAARVERVLIVSLSSVFAASMRSSRGAASVGCYAIGPRTDAMAWVTTNSAPSRALPFLRRLLHLCIDGGAAWLIVAASLALCTLSVYSIDLASSPEPYGDRALSGMALKQAALIAIGICAAVVFALPHYRLWGFASWSFMAVMVGFLVFLLIPFVPRWIVTPRNGARGWINLGPVDFQPAELAKVAYVLALAWYLRYSKTHRRFVGLIPPAIITGVPVLLIMLQPDLGTASLFIPVLFAVLVAAGAKLRHLGVIVLAAALAAPAAYPMLKPHQKQRIVGLVQQIRGDTSQDQDTNMQSVTAQRISGAGLGSGNSESHSRALVHFSRLPERHNDMIFAVIVNRFGLAGGIGVFSLYFLWIVGAFLTAASIREPFARLTIVGFAAFLASQVFINVGMNIGIVPIIGITLPYLSYGGSSMVTAWIMTGLILGIAVRRPTMPTRRSFEYSDADEE